LQPYEAALKAKAVKWDTLRKLTADNPAQQRHLDALEPLIAFKIEISRKNVEVRRDAGLAAAQADVTSGRGKAAMDAVRTAIEEMDAVEERLLAERAETSRREADTARAFTFAVWSVSAALIIVVFSFALHGHRLRRLANLNEARFRLMIENVQDYAIIMFDESGHVASWNAGAERTKGYRADEIIGRHFSRFYLPEDVAGGKPERELAVATAEGHFEGEGWLVRKDGSRFIANVVITALRDEAGALRGFAQVTRDSTGRKRAEEEIRALNADLERRVQERTAALRESEERFRQLTETMPDAVLVGQDGKNVYANPAAARLLRAAAPEALLGLDIFAIIDPARLEGARQDMQRLLAGEKIAPFEERLVRRDGSFVTVEIATCRFVWLGRPALQMVVRDNTARKAAEAALLKAGALQKAIFDSANFSSIATDAKGVIQIFNVGAERMLGYAAADVMNKITPADISDPQEVIARAQALSAELGTPITPGFEALVFKASRGIEDIYELTYIRKDGSRFPAVVSVTALRDAQDAIIGYLLIGTDNTARKQAEEALLKAGALQKAIFDSANFSSIATDAKGVIQIFNVGAERMLGYAAADVMNKITPADISDPQEVIARAKALSVELGTPITPGFEALVFKASRGIEDIYELTYIRKDGSRFPAVVSVTALRDAHNAIIGYLLIGTDNTARKAAAEALHQAHEALRRSNAELAQASRLKDEFLANMSHELRTPLNAILGLSEALLEQVSGTLTPRQAKSITTISTSGQHLLSLINDILDLSKVEAGKLELHAEPLNVEEFCQSCLVFVRAQAMQKKIDVTFASDGRAAKFAADPKRFKQILVNLLTNAVKFTPEGGRIGLTVAMPEREDAVCFTVWDTGIGIGVEDQPKLFRSFTQIDSGLTRAQDGTGLGLALVAKLVELHGGGVALESEPGKGSRFTVTLPQIAAPAPEPAPKAEADRRGYRRALIIEDDPTSGAILVNYLTELGLASVLHARGKESVAAALRERPDVILLDILLHDESGWLVLTRLKEHPQTRAIPVVVVSVVDEPAKSRAHGAVAHFTKPITRAQLAKFLQRATVEMTRSATPCIVPAPARGPLILLAEDNETNIETIGGYLKEKGYQMHCARNGLIAVQLARELRPALILMDVQMPVMDGLSAIKEIRADPALQAPPIVALTALAMSGDRERCLAVGATDYLSKPVSLKALAALIQQLLAAKEPGDATIDTNDPFI
jgi:PAS domain S-box-containing protein